MRAFEDLEGPVLAPQDLPLGRPPAVAYPRHHSGGAGWIAPQPGFAGSAGPTGTHGANAPSCGPGGGLLFGHLHPYGLRRIGMAALPAILGLPVPCFGF